MKTKHGWKVLLMPSRESISVSKPDAVKYPVNEWAVPNPDGGPLCVFDTREDAERFIDPSREMDGVGVGIGSLAPVKVVPCEYIPSKHDEAWIRDRVTHVIHLAPGTMLADRVKCLE